MKVVAPGSLKAGASEILRVEGDDVYDVQIRCYVLFPPPPGYRPCQECGVFRLVGGGSVPLHADLWLFANGGYLDVDVRSNVGDHEVIRITVAP